MHVNFQTDAAKKAWQDEVDLVTKYHVDDETSYAGQDINFFFQGHAAYAMKGPWVIPEGQRNFPDGVHLRPNAAVRGGKRLRGRIRLGRGGERQCRARDQGRGLEVHRLHDAAGQPARVESFHLHSAVVEVDAERSANPRGRPLLKVSFDVLPYGKWVGPVHNRDRFWQSIHDAFTAACLRPVGRGDGVDAGRTGDQRHDRRVRQAITSDCTKAGRAVMAVTTLEIPAKPRAARRPRPPGYASQMAFVASGAHPDPGPLRHLRLRSGWHRPLAQPASLQPVGADGALHRLRNYEFAFTQDPYFTNALIVTLKYALVAVPFNLINRPADISWWIESGDAPARCFPLGLLPADGRLGGGRPLIELHVSAAGRAERFAGRAWLASTVLDG